MANSRRAFLYVLILALFFGKGEIAAQAREVTLEVGQSFSEGDLTVRCAEAAAPEVIPLTDCQFWDSFNKECLYQRVRYRYGDLTCVEECQHWDSFNNVCNYATTCEFFPSQKRFVQTVCEVFDDADKVCRRTTQELIQ